MGIEPGRLGRCGGACELCSGADGLEEYDLGRDEAVVVCSVCRDTMAGNGDPGHWRCLQESAWSEVVAVQVLTYRLLKRLDAGWAGDLADQIYLDDDAQAWADAGLVQRAPTLDCNGTPLADGDSVTLIKDLPVKGANFTAKRGTLVKNIRLADDPGLVEGRVSKTGIFLKTEFIKKA